MAVNNRYLLFVKKDKKVRAINKAHRSGDLVYNIGNEYILKGPPEYDSVAWHEQMFNERHLFQTEIDGEIIGGALLFLIDDGKIQYIGRIFVGPIHHRKGYGISLMELVESYYPSVKKIVLDTPIWNVRTIILGTKYRVFYFIFFKIKKNHTNFLK